MILNMRWVRRIWLEAKNSDLSGYYLCVRDIVKSLAFSRKSLNALSISPWASFIYDVLAFCLGARQAQGRWSKEYPTCLGRETRLFFAVTRSPLKQDRMQGLMGSERAVMDKSLAVQDLFCSLDDIAHLGKDEFL